MKNCLIIKITKEIGKLKSNKSAGNDSIYNEIIRSASEILSPSLCKLFNRILDTGYFPQKDIWCQSINLKIMITQVIIEESDFPVA